MGRVLGLARIDQWDGVYGNIGPMKAAPAKRSGARRDISSWYWAPRDQEAATARSVSVASITARQSSANSAGP
jgi:hypothetical protein